MSVKQVIVYRRDLKMRKGKIAAQVAHASMKVFFDRLVEVGDSRYELGPDESWDWHGAVHPWVKGLFAKIVLSVETEADLLRVYTLAKKAGIPCALITDAGKTEFHGVPTRTTVALGPAEAGDIDKITGPGGAVVCKLA
jgi:PTH2 family peptidyl-tRNA hydrolase